MQGTKEKAERFAQSASDTASKVGDQAKESASNMLGAVKDTVQNVTSGAADMASKAAGQVRDTAKEWVGNAEDVAKNAARNVRDAAGFAADTVGDWGGEFAGLIRRNPIPAALIAVGIGYLAAMACRRDSA
jgi:ElaB/YqjD/DUF883 family membrane-anchored ribosome-binding protein